MALTDVVRTMTLTATSSISTKGAGAIYTFPTFTITYRNPCSTATLTAATVPTPNGSYILGNLISIPFTAGATSNVACGDFTYELYEEAGAVDTLITTVYSIDATN